MQRLTPLVDSRVDSDTMQTSPYPMSMTQAGGGYPRTFQGPAASRDHSLASSSKTVNPSYSLGSVTEKSSITSQESAVDKKIEAELEAERLWWSEVSERQVKELESTFGMEFQKTTDKLRVDISRCQDRLEMLVEQEKSQRQATAEALRRDLDTSQAATADIVNEVADLKKAMEVNLASKSTPSVDPKTLELVSRLQNDVEASRTQMSSNHASLRTEWEQHKIQTASTEVGISDLRRELFSSQEHQDLHLTQIKDLRRDLTALAEKVQLQAHSNDEVHALHQVIMQSAGDLSCGIEEVSSAVLATEQKLRQELEATRCALEASVAKQRVETLEALDLSSKQLAQSLADEVEKRGLEANILSARIDAMSGQLDDLQAASKRTAAALHSVPASSPAGSAEVQALRNLLDVMKGDLTRLEIGMTEDRTTALSAVHDSRRYTEDSTAAMSDRVARMEVLAAEERSSRLSDMADIRRYTEDVISKRLSQAAVEAGAGAQGIAGDQAPPELSSMASASIAAEVQAFRVDMASVKANLQVLDAECRRTASVAARTEAELQGLEVESRKSAGLPPRVESLAGRVEAAESELRQALSSLPDLRAFEIEVRRCMSESGAIASRLDANEAEVRRAAREASPLVARLEAIEHELQRVVRDSMPLSAKVESLRTDLKDLSVRMSTATTVAATTIGSQTPSTAGSAANERAANPPAVPGSMVSRLAQTPALLAAAGAAPAAAPAAALAAATTAASDQLSERQRGRSLSRQRQGPEVVNVSGPPSRGAVPVPALSSELKNTIESLVFKVNQTIKRNEGPPPTESEPTAPSLQVPTAAAIAAQGPAAGAASQNAAAAAAAMAAAAGMHNPALSGSMRHQVGDQSNAALATQDGFLQALQAVQELRERNLCLREENAELVEELLNQDGMVTPSQAYLGSASQSTCATPSQQLQPTAQLTSGLLSRGRSPEPNRTSVTVATVQREGAGPAGSLTKPMPQAPGSGAGSLSVSAPSVTQPYQGPIARMSPSQLSPPAQRQSTGMTPTTTTPGTASATSSLRFGRTSVTPQTTPQQPARSMGAAPKKQFKI